jgi:hypothetical protein
MSNLTLTQDSTKQLGGDLDEYQDNQNCICSNTWLHGTIIKGPNFTLYGHMKI